MATIPGWSLPEDLLFKIFARLPFPHIYRLRCLSKLWRSLLTHGSRLSDARAFEDQVRAANTAWPSYSPLQFRGGNLLGYNARAGKWSNFPVPLGSRGSRHEVVARCSGSLICWHNPEDGGGGCNVTIANILTGKFRHLRAPARSFELEAARWSFDLVLHAVGDGFTVVLIYNIKSTQDSSFQLVLLVYESSAEKWYTNFIRNQLWHHELPDREIHITACPRLADNSRVIISIANATWGSSVTIGSYDVKTKRWGCVEVGDPENVWLDKFALGICGSRIIVVGLVFKIYGHGYKMSVFEFSESSHQAVRLDSNSECECLIPRLDADSLLVSTDEVCVYACWVSESVWKGHAFDLCERVWTPLPDTFSHESVDFGGGEIVVVPGTISPGLNPFYDPSAR